MQHAGLQLPVFEQSIVWSLDTEASGIYIIPDVEPMEDFPLYIDVDELDFEDPYADLYDSDSDHSYTNEVNIADDTDSDETVDLN